MKFKLKILFYWFKILFLPKFKTSSDIRAYQEKKLNKFAKNTLNKSLFYKKYFNKTKFNWSAVPIITKTEFMNYFDEINTQNIVLKDAMEIALHAEVTRNFKSEIKDITVGLSTGTSGQRGIFLISENERAQWAALVMSRVIKPKPFFKQRVAFFLRANSSLYSSIDSRLFEFKYFDIFIPIADLLNDLNQYKPHILASQPSVLIDIARAQDLQDICIEPKQIISFAEVLHQNDREFIETTFNTKIKEVYQCTEGFLGVSCKYGTMHLNEDFIYFEKEWIDDDKFYPIVTDFTRSSQPVVNYKLNDVLQVKKSKCQCGSSLLAIEKIIGRDDDVLILNNIKVYPDVIVRKIAIQMDSFLKYTITQVDDNQLTICLDTPSSDWVHTKTLLETVLNEIFFDLDISNIEYNFQKGMEQQLGNKLRRIKRLINEN
jgi:putative adenylate-forming enzyme